ncbi:MAG: signal peptidase I [Candidatus Fimenecus sp.]|nr:signal peptidase I [Clostridia bacterium]
MNEKTIRNIYDFASILVSAVLAVCLIFTFVFKISAVDGDSMNNTLHNGDKVLITARDWTVERGDIVVISQPNAFNKVLIKRVIATEGQTVEINGKTHQVIVDGEVLEEPYIAQPLIVQGSWNYPVTVPEGCVFVMGDNRNRSTDSRDSAVGMIDTRYIVGEAIYRIGDSQLLINNAE